MRQMRKSVLRQTLHVRVTSDTQKIQSSDVVRYDVFLIPAVFHT